MTTIEDVAARTLVDREQMLHFFPNMHVLHEDTKFQVYREYKPRPDLVEITVYYREPGQEKFRIDAELKPNYMAEDLEYDYRDIRVVRWMSQSEYGEYLRRAYESTKKDAQ